MIPPSGKDIVDLSIAMHIKEVENIMKNELYTNVAKNNLGLYFVLSEWFVWN